MQTFDKLYDMLPVGQQGFADIRKIGCIYVDKTRFLYKLALSKQPLLLTRPRRFGKSTLVSTLEELFLILAIFLVLTARSSNAKALPCSAQLLRHSAAVHTARLGSNTICH